MLDLAAELVRRADEYELRAVSCDERAEVIGDGGASAVGFTVVAIVLREVAEAFQEAA